MGKMMGEEKGKEPRGEIGKREKSGEKQKKIEDSWWLRGRDNVSCSKFKTI